MFEFPFRRAAWSALLGAPLLFAGACVAQVADPATPSPSTASVAGVVQQDRIPQATGPVDVLVVVDNLDGAEVIAQLTHSFSHFADGFVGQGLDYHIGVVTADLDGTYPGAGGTLARAGRSQFIDPGLPNPIETFATFASAGPSVSPVARCSDAVYQALEVERDAANAGFWRDDAALHTIVVSGNPDGSVLGESEFVEWYRGLKADESQRTFSSIVDPAYGGRIRSLTRELGGIDATLDEDLDDVLTRLGERTNGVRTEYFLSQPAVESTIEVRVEYYDQVTKFVAGDYTYDPARNSIAFVEYWPTQDATVVVDYTVAATP